MPRERHNIDEGVDEPWPRTTSRRIFGFLNIILVKRKKYVKYNERPENL